LPWVWHPSPEEHHFRHTNNPGVPLVKNYAHHERRSIQGMISMKDTDLIKYSGILVFMYIVAVGLVVFSGEASFRI
jgi:hypothetical protein